MLPHPQQEQPEEQEVVGVVPQEHAPPPGVGGSELWAEGVSSSRRSSAGDAPRILYQCGDCELLFDSLSLWQQHRKQGDCLQGAPDAQGAEQAEGQTHTPPQEPPDPHAHVRAQADPNAQPAPEEETEAGPAGGDAGDGQVQATDEVALEARRAEAQVCVSGAGGSVSLATPAPVDPPLPTPSELPARRGRGVKRAKPPSVLLCVECGAGFSAIAELVSHRRSQHGLQEALHRCQVCGEGFLNTTLFLYHRKQHPQPHPAHTLTHALAGSPTADDSDHAHSHTLLALQQDVQVDLLEEAESQQQGLLLLAAAGEGQSLGLVASLAPPPDKPDHPPVAMETEATTIEAEAMPSDVQDTPTETEATPTENQVSLVYDEVTPTTESQTNELVEEAESQEEGEGPEEKRLKASGVEGACESVCVAGTGTFLCRVCGSSFSSEGALQRHREERHGQREALHTCGACGQEFMNTTLFLYHRRQHREHTHTHSCFPYKLLCSKGRGRRVFQSIFVQKCSLHGSI